MVLTCCAYGCTERAVKGGSITFHSFPKDEDRKKQWEIQIRRKNFKSTKFSKICSKHFAEEAFDREKTGGTWLKPTAIPTIFSFPEHLQERKKERKHPTNRSLDVGPSNSPIGQPEKSTNKRKYYPRDFNESDMASLRKARKVLHIAQRQSSIKNKKIKSLYRKKVSLEKKVSSLQEILKEIKKKSLISESASNILQLSEIAGIYCRYSKVPHPTAAYVLPRETNGTFLIHTVWSVQDLERNELTEISRNFVCSRKETIVDVISTGLSQDSTSRCMSTFSKTGNKQAILRKKSKNSESKQYIEIWSKMKKEETFLMADYEKIGDIYDDSQFACFAWNDDENLLLFVAEEKIPKSESFFKKKVDKPQEESTDTSPKSVGEEYLYREDWGESFMNKHHSVLCIFDVNRYSLKTMPTPEDFDVTVGQAMWGPEDKFILFVGWREEPRRLGIKYCTNRRSALYAFDLETEKIILIGNDEKSVRSPRFNKDKTVLVYLENNAGGPHHQCSKLMKYDWKAKEFSILVDIVSSPVGNNDFPGIYTTELPKRCWSNCGKYIFFTSCWRSKKVMIYVNVETGAVKKLIAGECIGSYCVLDVYDDLIVAAASSPDIEPYILIGRLIFNEEGGVTVSWIPLDENPPVKIPEINWTIIHLERSCGDYSDSSCYEVLFLTPAVKKESIPLIVWPHGGPHSVFSADFRAYSAAFAHLGFAVAMVNYRGSIGFGEDSLKSLLGNIGSQDVNDVHFATQYLQNFDSLKISCTALFGGSHGGFLVAHLSGQYPNDYSACVCRNPVIDISSKWSCSDIPDWAWVEVGCNDLYRASHPPTADMVKIMYEKSPIQYIENVSVPTLVLLGKKDLRVPPSQGLYYYRTLKARKVPVKLCIYDDNHALSSIAAESDVFMQTILWFQKHLKS